MKLINNVQNMKNVVGSEMLGIRSFLNRGDLLNLTIAVYLGTVLQKFFEDIIANMIYPLTQFILPSSLYEDADIQFFKVSINIGKIIKSFISFIIAVIISYFFVKFIENGAKKSL